MDKKLYTEVNKLCKWINGNLNESQQTKHGGLKKRNKPGIYIVYDGKNPIYVGRTSRTGRIRLSEMVSDYRSHTLNRKLMKEKINNDLKLGIKSLKNDTKEELIQQGKISRSDFEAIQRDVNTKIKNMFKFLFIPCENELIRMEHWLIALLNPQYND